MGAGKEKSAGAMSDESGVQVLWEQDHLFDIRPGTPPAGAALYAREMQDYCTRNYKRVMLGRIGLRALARSGASAFRGAVRVVSATPILPESGSGAARRALPPKW